MKRFVLLSCLITFLFVSSAWSQTLSKENIYFKSGAHALNEENKDFLQNLYASTIDFTESTIKIIGHTDQDGTNEFNLDLSNKRAQAVKQFLVNQGFLEANIKTTFLGETALIHQSNDSTSKKENRRVTIILEGYTYHKVDEMVSQISHENNDFHTIDQNIESHIQLKKGTEVNIPENAFCHLDGTPVTDQKIDLVFKEVFDYDDMVDEHLFTQTADRILETGGMIYVEANQNGVPLKLRDGKSISLTFPEQEFKEGMELFTGVQTENGIIWEETGEEIESVRSDYNMPFIEVDLSPIIDLDLGQDASLKLSFAPMPPFPHPARIAYPPYKENYTNEEYSEAVKKYEAVMKAYEEDKIDRPERLAKWIAEAERRKEILKAHKEKYIRSKVVEILQERIVKLKENKEKVSHERLIGVLFAFLDRSVGKIDYNDWYYTKLAFGKNVVEARKYVGVELPEYKYAIAGYFFPDFNNARRVVEGAIAERKYELGYIDANTLSRYVVAASQLGWINCDKFYEMAENEKKDLQFARIAKDDRYYLIFKDMRSLVRPNGVEEGGVKFSGVPIGKEVRLVVVNMESGNARMAVHDFNTNDYSNVKLRFEPTQIKGLKKALEI